MTRVVNVLSATGFAVFLAATIGLAQLERGGPPHADLVLDGGIPATLYLPGAAERARALFLDPPARGERPPAVVLMHGFASDRAGMSVLARRLAASGFAVLCFDSRGHGQSRSPFVRGLARPGSFAGEFATAVDFLRTHPFVDGARIAVMGHSMGAGAALDFATRDAGLAATVLISGGWVAAGPYRPSNALFVYAAADPPLIRDRSDVLAARLAEVSRAEPGRSYGRASDGSAVRLVEVTGADHATIVWSEAATREIVAWLDAAFGLAERDVAVPGDPRLAAVGIAGVATLLVLPGLGLLAGRIAGRVPARPGAGARAGLPALALTLLLSLPLAALGPVAWPLSLEVGDVIATHFLFCGLLLLLWQHRSDDRVLSVLRQGPARALGAAAAVLLALTALLQPVGTVVHGMALTPERVVLFPFVAACLAPFGLAYQLALRRGSPIPAALNAALGRVLVLGVLAVGVGAGVLSPVVALMIPALTAVFALTELLAAAIYAASRNLLAIALLDAGWLALVLVSAMPVRL